MKHLSPAEYVIHVFKGVRATARAIGRTPSAVSKWPRPKNIDRQGCAGRVPQKAQVRILEEAKKRGLDITINDLFYGREVSE